MLPKTLAILVETETVPEPKVPGEPDDNWGGATFEGIGWHLDKASTSGSNWEYL